MDDIIDSSMISIGNYEILFSSIGGDRKVQYLNNASVKFDINLQFKINRENENKSVITSVSFLMPKDEAKLGDIFLTSPYGLIKKNRTGVGATTLELNSPRNSIIIVPTKTLAYNKAKNSKIKIKGEEKYKIQYVGGTISGFKIPTIEKYLSDSDIEDKKFLVVADSLPKLLNIIGEENYKDYFFMVDEIDSYQYDGYYRPALENVIDYYFKFPPTQRCLVSATVGEFSNPEIQEEPIINVTFNEPQPRNITLLHTNNVIATTVKHIKATIEQHPDEKILIAYNLVRRGMIPIIESLDEALRKECAILCSTTSKVYAGDYYTEIIEKKLSNKITFMSCTYFVGVDISERFHLISISDSDFSHTLLSEDKLEQIAGRCRDSEGLLSETIIYKSRNKIDNKQLSTNSLRNLKDKIIKESKLLADFINTIPVLKNIYPELKENWLRRINMDDIVTNSLKSYYNTQEVKLIRKDIDSNFQPAYLNIDNILIQFKLLNTLYSSKDSLFCSLKKNGNKIIDFQDLIENEERISKDIQDGIKDYITAVETDEIEDIIEQLRKGRSLEEKASIAFKLKKTSTNNAKTFIDRFLELQRYLPFERLVSTRPQYKSENQYNKFYNSIIFWALSEEHPFKIAFKEKFPLDVQMTGERIKENLNSLLMTNLGFKELDTTNKAYNYLIIFCKKGNRIKHRELGYYHLMKNYNVNDFDFQPIETINAKTDISKLFRFPKDVLIK